jgi:hypothetical protein
LAAVLAASREDQPSVALKDRPDLVLVDLAAGHAPDRVDAEREAAVGA